MTDARTEIVEQLRWRPGKRYRPTGRGWTAVQLRSVADSMEDNDVAFLGEIQLYRKATS